MWRFAVLCIAPGLFAQQRGLDLVVLLEGSPGVQLGVSPVAFTGSPADRIAVVRFTKKSSVEQPFTNDAQGISVAIQRVIRGTAFHSASIHSNNPPHNRVLRAVLDAAHLFDTLPRSGDRQRVMISVFATEDASGIPAEADVREALLAAWIKFFGIAVHWRDGHVLASRFQTPPTIPGQYPNVLGDVAPLPEATMTRVAALASATGGQLFAETADVSTILAGLR